MIRTWLFLAAWCLTAGSGELFPAAAAADEEAGAAPLPLVEFRIKDQFDVLHTSGYFRNSVVVVVSGDRKGHEFMGPWQTALADSLAPELETFRVKIIRHAHLKGAPFFVKGKIKSSFSRDPDQWVLMDWEGVFREAYDFREDYCSIVVFDSAGVRQLQLAVTVFDSEVFLRLLGRIRELAG